MVGLIINLKPESIRKRQMELRMLESKKVPKSVEKRIQKNPVKKNQFSID